MGNIITITGGTGFLGRNWIPEILARDSDSEVYVLTRNPNKKTGVLTSPRVHLVEGDVREEQVIRDPKLRAEVLERTKEFYHAVSSTSFFESDRTSTFNLNVDGTKNMIEFAKKTKGLERFVYVSTAYVENRRQLQYVPEDLPLVSCDKLPAGNPYEESKIEAERVIRESGLDWTILRPGIFSGDSKTGFTGFDNRMGYGVLIGVLFSVLKDPRIKTIDHYWKLREFRTPTLDIPCRLRGYNDVTKNFMFMDDIVGQTEAVLTSNTSSQRVYHILTKTPITTEQMLDSINQALGLSGAKFVGDIRDSDITRHQHDYVASRRAASFVSKPYGPYFTRYEPIWRTDNTDRCLKERGYNRVDMSQEKFSWLMQMYVKNELSHVLNNSNGQL